MRKQLFIGGPMHMTEQSIDPSAWTAMDPEARRLVEQGRLGGDTRNVTYRRVPAVEVRYAGDTSPSAWAELWVPETVLDKEEVDAEVRTTGPRSE